jgi:dihydrofolate synthase/folylpolyglutamate synthase
VEIAREKAGIAKQGLDLLVGPAAPEVRAAIDEVAAAAGATTSDVPDVSLPSIALRGAHQQDNARMAAALARRIGAAREHVEEGIARVQWPGRLEHIASVRGGDVLLDGAHNADGAAALAAHVSTLGIPAGQVALVFGALADKDWAPMLDVLAPVAHRRFYVPAAGASRAAADPHAMANRHAGTVSTSVEQALDLAAAATAAGPPALRIVCGSLLTVGQARASLLGLPRDPPVAL